MKDVVDIAPGDRGSALAHHKDGLLRSPSVDIGCEERLFRGGGTFRRSILLHISFNIDVSLSRSL